MPYFAGVLTILKDFREMSCGRLDRCYAGHVMKTCTKEEIRAKAVYCGRFPKWGIVNYYFDKDMKEIGCETDVEPNRIYINITNRVWSEWSLDGLNITKLK